MSISCHRTLRRSLGAALFFSVVLVAGAAPTTSTFPLAPHGDGSTRSQGSPIPLSPNTFVIVTQGADGDFGSQDDTTVVFQDGGAGLTSAAVPTPNLAPRSGRTCQLSATSSLLFSAGQDGSWQTADDSLHLLTRIGSGNVSEEILVGGLHRSGTGSPFALSANSAVIITTGADFAETSADDEVVVLTDLGDGNDVAHLPAPFLNFDYYSRPIPLSPTAFLVASAGPDAAASTADDVVYLFTDVGGANTRTDLPTPWLPDSASGRATRLTASRAVMASTGADGSYSTADDELYLLDDLGGANTVTPIATGPISDYSAGCSVAMRDDTVVVCSPGPDESDHSADDGLVVVTGLGTTNTVQFVSLPGIDEDRQNRPLRLSQTSCAVLTGGPDASYHNTDDTVAIITDVGGANNVTHIPVPGLAGGATSTPCAISSTSLLLRNGGPNGTIGSGGDDVVTLITSATTAPQVMTFATGEDDGTYDAALVPVTLGSGRAVFLNGGADDRVGQGGDDEVVVIDGLDRARDLTVAKLWIKFKPTKPQKGEKLQVKGVIALDAAELFACSDVTISIGNAAQTIPAAMFTQNKKGDWKYKDKKRTYGFIKSFVYKQRSGKFTLVGKGLGTGAETTDADYVPVVIQCAELFLGDSFVGELKKPGIKYKAPK